MSGKPNVGELVEQNAQFLFRLANVRQSKAKAKNILDQASFSELFSIVEVCLNILKGRIPLSVPQRRQLEKVAKIIRVISRVRSEKRAHKVFRKEYQINQSGKGIPIVASIAASVLLPFLSEFLSKKVLS